MLNINIVVKVMKLYIAHEHKGWLICDLRLSHLEINPWIVIK